MKVPVLGETLPGIPSNGAAPIRLSTRSSNFDYEASVQSILADREGLKSWPQLERLEQRAAYDPLARRALFRLETLNGATEYGQEQPATKPCVGPRRLAHLLDASEPRTQKEGWGLALRGGSLRQKLAVLKESRDSTGWQALGYPPCIAREVGPASPRVLEDPENWNRLVGKSLAKSLAPESEDPRLAEYRALVQARRKLQKGEAGNRISQCSLNLDIKALEEQLLPEHLAKATGEAKERFLGSEESAGHHPQSRVRQFLGRLSAIPESSRERHIYSELTRVAHRGPGELGQFAAHLIEEIKGCPHSFSAQLLPQFWKALSEVSRTRSEQVLQGRRLGSSESFNNLLTALHGEETKGNESSDGLELFRSGLTVNGMVRNYTQ